MPIAYNRSNRLNIMFLKMTITGNNKITLLTTDNAIEFLNNVEEHFYTTNKSLVGTLMANLTTMKFDGTHGMHEYTLVMTNLAAESFRNEC